MGQEGHLALFQHVVESCQSVCPTGWTSEEETKEDPRSLWWKLRKEEYFIEFR